MKQFWVHTKVFFISGRQVFFISAYSFSVFSQHAPLVKMPDAYDASELVSSLTKRAHSYECQRDLAIASFIPHAPRSTQSTLPVLLKPLGYFHSNDSRLHISNEQLVNSALSAALPHICFSLSLCWCISALFTLTLNDHIFTLRGRPQTAYHSSDM